MSAANIKITVVWLVLCLTTVVSVGASGASASTLIGVLVLGAAFIKVHLVMHYFMELDNAPLPWRFAFLGWVLIVFIILSILLLQGSS